MVERSNRNLGISRVNVTTNFFRLERSPINNVSIYSYSFSPEIESDNRSLRTHLLMKGKDALEASIGMFIRAGNTLYSKILKKEPFNITVSSHDQTEYSMTIIWAGLVTGENIDSYRMYANSALKKMLQCLDLKQVTKMPKYYDIRQTQRVDQHRLEVWRGYSATFSHHLREMLLNIDFSSKIIRDTTALEAMEEIRNNPRTGNLKDALENELVGHIVMAKYGNFKCYRIEAILDGENPTMSFDTKEGSISYMEYFKTKYNILIKNTRQPLLKSFAEKGSKEIKLIPELCVLTGISEEIKRDYRAMNDIANFTRLEPGKRLEVSTVLSHRLANDRNCKVIGGEYNIQLDPKPIIVDGLRFDPEVIKVGERDSDFVPVDRKGSFNIRGSILKSVSIDNWMVLTTERDSVHRSQLIKTLVNKAGQIGLKLGTSVQLEYNPRNVESIIKSLSSGQYYPLPQLILVVVAPNDKKVYNEIKSSCALNLGIPTQCLKSSNITNAKKFDSIMSKLIIQIAVKTGSVAWRNLHPVPDLPIKTMVVGIDVFHDTVQKAKSVMGFVASVHPQFTNYYNTTRIHEKSGQEIAGHVGDCMIEAINAFFIATKQRFRPEVIIVYRDGVADSQISACQTFEVQSIKSNLQKFPGYNPSLVYVIVNKKTNAKLFSDNQRGYENPQPGTLINSIIIPEDKSFYLISHSVTQGMASPTLYRIIDNEREVDTIVIARLAFKLCYMYYNWTGGIKVPAPTMMAHKLAFLVGQSVHQTHLEQLRLLPWFY
jgi:aubergine